MSKELEERIEKKKQMLRDYLRLSEQWKFKKEDIERMMDMYLDDPTFLVDVVFFFTDLTTPKLFFILFVGRVKLV